jgi:hypothetical protein
MKVKLFEDVAPPFIGGVECNHDEEKEIKNTDHLKHYIEKGVDIRVLEDGEYIKGEEYFSEDKEEKEVKTKKVTSGINTLDFEEIFDGHWKTQVKEIKEIEDVKLVEKAIEYTEANDVSDTVAEKAKEHLEDLREE